MFVSGGPILKWLDDTLPLCFCLFFFNVYLFLRERARQSANGEGQRERETQNLKQALGSELSAQSPMRGSNS